MASGFFSAFILCANLFVVFTMSTTWLWSISKIIIEKEKPQSIKASDLRLRIFLNIIIINIESEIMEIPSDNPLISFDVNEV